MPTSVITATQSTFGTISGTLVDSDSTISGTVSGPVVGYIDATICVPCTDPTVQNNGGGYNNGQFTTEHYPKELVFVVSGHTYAVPARLIS
jgi:hypothetical protein